jgi:RNA polymerase sigma-70 factor (ECF subfamily)
VIRFRASGHDGVMRELGLTAEDALSVESDGAGTVTPEQRVHQMVETHYDFVWRCLRRLGVRPGDVDDAAQQVFWIAYRKVRAIRSGAERAFLFQTALRVAADARRAIRRRREEPAIETDAVLDSRPGPDDQLDLHRARRRLDEVLDRMPFELRAVFVLFELEQMTLTEIAALLEIPRGTVASRLRTARRKFYEAAALSFPERRGDGS